MQQDIQEDIWELEAEIEIIEQKIFDLDNDKLDLECQIGDLKREAANGP